MATYLLLVVMLIVGASQAPAVLAEDINVLALGEGAVPITEAPGYSGWPASNILDDAAASGWASAGGRVTGNSFVFELAAPAAITAFEFDTSSIDGNGRGAKDVTVEVSVTAKDAGYTQVLAATLADRKDRQRFAAQVTPEARWVRLTIATNNGDAQYSELMGFRGYAAQPKPVIIGDISGVYRTNYNDFHLRQQGTALTGCYEFSKGVFEGTIDGRVMKLTWTEDGGRIGPAVLVFAPDGSSFRGFWWAETDKGRAPQGVWNGTRVSKTVGVCPHWSGSVSGELRKDLADAGRARLYGILFDTDSARIRAESLPTLDEVVKLLVAEPQWKLTIEGHTDSTGTAARNLTLSTQRAASVRDYLVGKGASAARLTAVGLGQSKPVADNTTELGRARNRRVELVRN